MRNHPYRVLALQAEFLKRPSTKIFSCHGKKRNLVAWKKKAYWSVYSRSLHIISKTQRNVLLNRKTKSAQTTYHIGGLVLGNYVINSTWNAFDTMIYFEPQKNLQNIGILQFAYNCLVLSKTEIFSVVKASPV